MTVQIKGLQIAGLPAVTIRNLLRRAHSVLDDDFVVKQCKVPEVKASEVISQLAQDGYIEIVKRSPEQTYVAGKEEPRFRWAYHFKLTDKGDKLVGASAAGQLSRERAERIIAGVLKRVEQVNAIADYMYRVPTVILFGSYVRGESQLGDVDIAVDLEAKWDHSNHEQYMEWRGRRIEAIRATGRAAPDNGGINWPHREVMLHLKARTKGLSLHELYDFIGMKKNEKFAYKVLLGDAKKIEERLAKE